jgi:formylglycine-generating enzyme required for sulfatase activity
MSKYPITVEQYAAFCPLDGEFKSQNGRQGEDKAPVCLCIAKVDDYCTWLNRRFASALPKKCVFRLPTDAEWEYASKGGKNLDGMLGKTLGRARQTGSSSRDSQELEAILLQMGYTGEDHARVSDIKKPWFMWNTLPVGKHKPNEWGFMDLIGNAWEVTADKMMDFKDNEPVFQKGMRRWNGWCQSYPDFEIDPQLKGERHLIRTGFWDKGAATSLGNKYSIGDNDRFPAVGFRVCIGAPLGDWNNATTTTPKLVKDAFALNAAPGSITEIDLGNVPPLQFVYCPAGKFSMGYKEQPALSKVKDVEITSPFWVSKTVIRADQLESLGINFTSYGEKREAWINDASIVVQKLPSVLKERFGKMLPPGYVFRLPTEAEFEYLQKAETNDKDAPTNIWGVERLYSGGYIGLLDRAPAYGRGVDVVNRRSRAVMTDLVKVNYENQPDKDPVGWSDDPNWSVFRRGLARNCGGGKLITSQGGRFLYGFYFVVAPDVDKLNKFYWK